MGNDTVKEVQQTNIFRYNITFNFHQFICQGKVTRSNALGYGRAADFVSSSKHRYLIHCSHEEQTASV